MLYQLTFSYGEIPAGKDTCDGSRIRWIFSPMSGAEPVPSGDFYTDVWEWGRAVMNDLQLNTEEKIRVLVETLAKGGAEVCLSAFPSFVGTEEQYLKRMGAKPEDFLIPRDRVQVK
jgi:hypothetical protein